MLAVPAPVRATLMMLGAVGISGLQNCLMRLLADHGVHAFTVTFGRNAFGLLSVWAIMAGVGIRLPRTRFLGPIAIACVLHVVAMLTFMLGIPHLPLNESAALSFAMPLFVTIGAALFLGETVRARRWSAVAAGFVGILVILRPGVVPVGYGATMILLSTICGASVTLMFKRFARGEEPLTLIFYQCLISSLLSLPLAAAVWTPPAPVDLGLLVVIGVIGTVTWIGFLRSIRLVDASAIMPIEFVKLPSVAFFAYLMFGELPDEWIWLGAAIIFGSTLYIAHREAVVARQQARAAATER